LQTLSAKTDPESVWTSAHSLSLLFHEAVLVIFQSGDTSVSLQVCRIELRKNLVAAMDAQGADALIYPSWANPARLIGDYDSPLGDNSQNVCPPTGMPGITVPMVS
jgi:hypothetical protein